jgi:hypothetical protein
LIANCTGVGGQLLLLLRRRRRRRRSCNGGNNGSMDEAKTSDGIGSVNESRLKQTMFIGVGCAL